MLIVNADASATIPYEQALDSGTVAQRAELPYTSRAGLLLALGLQKLASKDEDLGSRRRQAPQVVQHSFQASRRDHSFTEDSFATWVRWKRS